MARKLEMLANVAIIVVAVLFSATIIKDRYLRNTPQAIGPSALTVSALQGTHLNVSGVKWDQAEKTVVLALSTQCHFCQESLPFYRDLTASKAVTSNRVAVVAIFPQQLPEAQAFINAGKIQPSTVLSMPLQTIGTSSTPTLLLVNHSGIVERLWVGVLSSSQRNDLLSELDKLGS